LNVYTREALPSDRAVSATTTQVLYNTGDQGLPGRDGGADSKQVRGVFQEELFQPRSNNQHDNAVVIGCREMLRRLFQER